MKKGFIDQTYGKAMSYVKDRREEADYGISIRISREEAKDIIEKANSFLVNTKKAINMVKKKSKNNI